MPELSAGSRNGCFNKKEGGIASFFFIEQYYTTQA